jgi:amino acid transporter
MPDSGTSLTWTSKAFGPYIGWLGGWAAVLATIIVLSNLAGVAVQFLYQFIGSAVNSEMISGLWGNKLINVATCLVFLAIATYIAYRGIDTTEHVQMVLVIFQLVVLVLFSIMAIAKSGTSEVGEAFSLAWFSPTGLTLSAFIAGLSGSIFAFWGWDTALTVNEESKNSDTTPGRAALLCVVSILLTYLLVSVATQMYAGLGETGLGLTNPDVSDNVFGNLAVPILGHPLDLALFLAVLASSAASLITTFLPTSRTLLAMGVYQAMPRAFAKLHSVHNTPSVATFAAGIGAATFYTVMTVLSERVLTHTILSLGIMICFYYGVTAFGCIWFFRHQLFSSPFNIVFKFLFPLLGGLGLFFVLIITLRDSADPAYGSGAGIGGVGLVLILGLGLILVGLIFMAILRVRQPAFFRGETIIHESAHAMRPHEHLVS